MSNNKFKDQISSILPDRGSSINYGMSVEREAQLKEAAEKEQKKANANEIAKALYREKRQLETLERKAKDPESFLTPKQQERLKEKRENVQLLEAIDTTQPVMQVPEQAMPLLGTTRTEVAKLLTSLNINVNLNLTKSDTYNLLSCLLTCNEKQLEAIYANKKVPIAIKTVIKRLLEDAKLGNIETVEKLWDRVFGKAGQVTIDLPTNQPTENGIIPKSVVSREAYVLIKETVIGKD